MNFKENESAQKLRGGYYTSLDLANYLSKWVAETHPKSIFGPSCGDGIFLEWYIRQQDTHNQMAVIARASMRNGCSIWS
ncbi:MAG: hypothetical protein F4142_10965 [Nitrospira sp. SB0675_bin_23]|nr:hypothetical protein [Nitrospira sp. SB0675_bin_23]